MKKGGGKKEIFFKRVNVNTFKFFNFIFKYYF